MALFGFFAETLTAHALAKWILVEKYATYMHAHVRREVVFSMGMPHACTGREERGVLYGHATCMHMYWEGRKWCSLWTCHMHARVLLQMLC